MFCKALQIVIAQINEEKINSSYRDVHNIYTT